MRPVYKRAVLACALVFAAAAGAWTAYPRPVKQPHANVPAGMRAAKVVSPSLSVSARSTKRGEILVSATANVTHPFRDAVLWYNVLVRRLDEAGGAEQVWAHAFDGVLPDGTQTVKVYTNARKGEPVKAVLPEFPIPAVFPPGAYAVFVEVVEDAPEAGPEGITNPTHGIVGNTTVVTLK